VLIELRLLSNPIEHRTPQSIWAFRIHLGGGAVATARNLGADNSPALRIEEIGTSSRKVDAETV
jgi:hypothetical protein